MNKAQEKDRAGAVKRDAEAFVAEAWPKINATADVPRLVERLKLDDASGGAEMLPAIMAALKGRSFEGVAVLAGVADKTVHLAVSVSPKFTGRFNAGKDCCSNSRPSSVARAAARMISRGARGVNPARSTTC